MSSRRTYAHSLVHRGQQRVRCRWNTIHRIKCRGRMAVCGHMRSCSVNETTVALSVEDSKFGNLRFDPIMMVPESTVEDSTFRRSPCLS
jgi:hypothetical protein